MERRITAHDYFTMPETNRPAELVYGVVREPPAPLYGHQKAVGQLSYLLKAHVEKNGLGEVCVSPIDVVLDEPAALVVQPDVIYVSKERSSIIRNHVSGAPDVANRGGLAGDGAPRPNRQAGVVPPVRCARVLDCEPADAHDRCG